MERKASAARSDLQQMVADETAPPKALPLSLLEDITGDFSDDQEIGRGGFAVVYKGILGDMAVAVKRLSNAFMYETEFHREVECLMRVKHKNVVRFLGYCADTQGSMERYNGKLVMADVQQRLLCFEYIPKGSLDKYIIDAYREWETCYKIIKGICAGLQYLHENHIIHLDLKPANILLDDNMVPKITDFGLSRCFDENQSRDITKTILGTMGYLAPELREGGVIASSADLYSLGVIIIEILTGQKGYQAIGDVLESWSDRLEKSQRDTLCEQIRVCYEIALECRDFDPKKRPASARDIIDRLHEMKSIQTGEAASCTSGMVATKSKGKKSNSDEPRVSLSVPRPRRDAHAHPLAGRMVMMPRPAGPASAAYGLVEMKAAEAWETEEGLTNVYYSPKLMYLKVVVISAQDIIPADKGRPLAPVIAKIQLGRMIRRTRSQGGSANPTWNEELMFVAGEPFEDPLVVTVEERVAPGRDEAVGRVIIPVASPYVPRNDLGKSVPSKWFSLSRGMTTTVGEAAAEVTDNNKEESKTLASKIHLRLSLETAYHLLDESTYYSSDLQPKLRKSAIGVLQVDILGARDLAGMKHNPYVVAKYGKKWGRTRTLFATAAPQWNEHYTWDVFDVSTVIIIAVFDDSNGDASRDQRIGKVRVRLATLEADRLYTQYYPLMVLSPSGLKKMGELHLAVRFTCKSWAKMLAMYGKPLLPKMHHTNPISVTQLDYLRSNAMQMVATRLARADPPLRREVVEYMLDVDSHMFSLRRSKANIYRITTLFSGAAAVGKWFDATCKWKNTLTTILVHVVFLQLVCYPELILPTVFLCLSMIVAWNYRQRPRKLPHMDTVLSRAELAHPEELDKEFDTLQPPHIDTLLRLCKYQAYPDELDEEFDTFPTSKPHDIVRLRYDRLRSVASSLQTVVGDLATQGERAHSILRWRDPRLTAVFTTLSLVVAVVLYLTPLRVVAMVMGLYFLRPPCFRSRSSLLFNLYARLPSKDDMML